MAKKNAIGHVTGLYRYPVKSMAGEHISRSRVTKNGFVGDRAWAIRDEVRGGIKGAKRFAPLMSCRAYYPNPPTQSSSEVAHIVLPDGSEYETGDPSLVDALSVLVDNPISLWPLVDPTDLEHYKRTASDTTDPRAELKRIFGRTPEESLPDLSGFPKELVEYESMPGTYFDALPILIMSEQSLASLNRLAPESIFDLRRFRPNLLLDLPDLGDFPERSLLGQTVTVGSTTFDVKLECPRCIMTTHGLDELPRDTKILRTLVETCDGNLGVYAEVRAEGIVSANDTIHVE